MQTLSPIPSKQTLQSSVQLQKTEVFETSSRYLAEPDLPRYKSFYKLVLHFLVLSMSSFYFGYSLAYISSIDFLTIISVYGITQKREVIQGILVACIPVGGGIGALLSGYFLRKLSRRRNVLMINCVAFIAGLVLYVPKLEVLIAARLLQGICAGFLSSVGPLIMKQTAPNEVSGTLTSFNQMFIAFGVFFAFMFSLIMGIVLDDPMGERTWKIVFGLPLLVVSVQSFLLMCVYPFETPKYLFSVKEDTRGRLLVERVYKQQYVDDIIREIKINLGQQVVDRSSDDKSETFTLSINEAAIEENKIKTPRNAVIVAIHLAALQQFCGINAVIAYGGQIAGGNDPTLKLMIPILINLEQVIAAIFTSYLLSVIGRKALLQVGSAMACVGCGIIAVGFFLQDQEAGIALVLIIFGLVLFMANFGFTLGPVVWVYLPEIVQPNVMPYATMVNWASAAIIMLLFPVIKQTLPNKNPAFLFLFFAIWSTLSFFFNKKFLLQTQNKGEKQIFEEYRIGRQIKQY